MLIEFSVANFGSFKEPQTLEMLPAENIQSLPGHCFATGLSDDQPQHLLRSAVVYGPNASGKTHLVKAASFMRGIVLNSNRKAVEESISVNPFLLDPKTLLEPSALQMIFVVDGRCHQYGFKVNTQRILSEWCYVFSSQEEELISFRREYDPDEDAYHVETHLLEGLEEALQGVPEDWLAITQFGQEKKRRWPELEATYRWFQRQLRVVHADKETGISTAKALGIFAQSEGHEFVLNFLKAADLGVESIKISFKGKMPKGFLKVVSERFSGEVTEDNSHKGYGYNISIGEEYLEDFIGLGVDLQGATFEMVRTMPQTGKPVSFDMAMESSGTQKMFDLAVDWMGVLNEGQVFFVDELEAGLHHRLVRFLLDLIHDPERNSHGAQLIATTHDTALLDEQIIRPDQIWLMNKTREYASRIFPLSDFEIRLEEGETLQKLYLDGLYGAVPMVRKRRLPVSMDGDQGLEGKKDAKKSTPE